MKNLTLAVSFLAFASVANAGPGASKMSSFNLMGELNTSKFIARKASTMQKRTYMQGYKPKEQITPEFQYDNITDKKIIFVDKNHERYISPGKQQSLKEGTPTTEQKDDHTLIVKLKKKEN